MEQNEKSERLRLSANTKIESSDKGKNSLNLKQKDEPTAKHNINHKFKKFNSKIIKPHIKGIENQQHNIMMQGTTGVQVIQSGVPIVPNNFYQVQPQMMGNGVPILYGTMPGQGQLNNAYITNQIGPTMVQGTLNYGLDQKIIINDFCPFCLQQCVPKVEKSFNCCTCFVFTILIFIIPVFIILAAYSGCQVANSNNGCDCNCNCCCCDCCCSDEDYFCPKCGKKIGNKNSFFQLCPCFKCFKNC